MSRTSTDILLEDLIATKAPAFMLRKARDGQYNDYQSDSAHPIIDLVRDATTWNLHTIVEQAKAGKYDGTQEESEAWFQREGKDMLEETPSAPRNVVDMPGQFAELEEINIAEWHPEPNGQGRPTQVHLMFTVQGVPDMTMVLRCKGPDMLARIINALSEHGRNVFGADLARQLKRYA
jgi:hypothetical protein